MKIIIWIWVTEIRETCFLLQEAYKLLTKYNAVTEEETKKVSDLRNVFTELQSKAVSTFISDPFFYFTPATKTRQQPEISHFDSYRNQSRMSFMICSQCSNKTSWTVPSLFKTTLAHLWMNMTQWVLARLQCKGGSVSPKLLFFSVLRKARWSSEFLHKRPATGSVPFR